MLARIAISENFSGTEGWVEVAREDGLFLEGSWERTGEEEFHFTSLDSSTLEEKLAEKILTNALLHGQRMIQWEKLL